MQERSASPPLANILLFIVILVLALFVYPRLVQKFFPQPPKVANAPVAGEQKGDKAADKKAADKAGDKQPAKEKDKPGAQAKGTGNKPKIETAKEVKPAQPEKAQPNKVAAPEKKGAEPRRWVTLGSVDPDRNNPYRMLVTLSNEGASVARIELSSEHYRDLEDRGGYLGHLVMDNADQGPGCLVQVVGAGTPAAMADLRPGDRIRELVYQGKTLPIESPAGLEMALRKTKPAKARPTRN